MKRKASVVILAGIILAAALSGCKKRYFPRIQEEVIDQGVPVEEEFVVE